MNGEDASKEGGEGILALLLLLVVLALLVPLISVSSPSGTGLLPLDVGEQRPLTP